MIRTQPLAAVAMVAVLALQPPSSTEPPPPTSSSPAPTSSSEPPPVSSSSATPPPSSSPSVPTVPSSTEPPPTSAPPPPPVPAPVAGGGREWTLKASRLELGGLNFVGVVDALLNGKVVKVLKFTTSDMKIKDLVQSTEVSPGVRLVTAARAGSTSTVHRKNVNGQVPPPIELFTVQLKGNLDILGIKIPVDYTAAHPPPLNVPFVTFTDVTVRNTDLKGGTLTIPGARISVVSDQAPVARR